MKLAWQLLKLAERRLMKFAERLLKLAGRSDRYVSEVSSLCGNRCVTCPVR